MDNLWHGFIVKHWGINLVCSVQTLHFTQTSLESEWEYCLAYEKKRTLTKPLNPDLCMRCVEWGRHNILRHPAVPDVWAGQSRLPVSRRTQGAPEFSRQNWEGVLCGPVSHRPLPTTRVTREGGQCFIIHIKIQEELGKGCGEMTQALYPPLYAGLWVFKGIYTAAWLSHQGPGL